MGDRSWLWEERLGDSWAHVLEEGPALVVSFLALWPGLHQPGMRLGCYTNLTGGCGADRVITNIAITS